MARGRPPGTGLPSRHRTPAPGRTRPAPAGCNRSRRAFRAASSCAGSAASRRRPRSQGSSPRRMACRSSRARSASRDMPPSCGASHSCASIASAASDRSGQPASGSSRRISATRAWSWRTASVQGSGRRSVCCHRAGERRRDLGGIGRLGAVGQHQRAEPPPPSRQHRAGDRIEAGLHLFGDARRRAVRRGRAARPA